MTFDKNDALVLIESNTSGTGYVLASIANEKGIKVFLITDGLTQYRFDDFVTKLITDTSNLDHIRREITKLSESFIIRGITSTSDYYLETATMVAEKFNCSHPSLETIKLCRNKFLFRKKLDENEFIVPSFKVINNLNELSDFFQKDTIVFPLVVKPITGSGSLDVKLFYDKNHVISHAKNILKRETNDRNQKIDNSILIEEYYIGEEYSLELFDGKIIGGTKKYKGELPYFIETGHDFPFQFDEETQEQLDSLIMRLVKIMDLSWGAYHIEFIKNEKGICIIEINPRLAGGFIPVLIKESIGIDIIEILLNKVLNERVNLTRTDSLYSSIRFLIPKQEGKMKIKIEDKLFRNNTSSVQYKLYRPEVSKFTRNNNFKDRIGHVITTNIHKNKAISDCNELMKNVMAEIEYEELSATGRLNKGIHKNIRKIIFGDVTSVKDITELRLLSKINRAHLLMLIEEGILSSEVGVQLLHHIVEFEKQEFLPLLNCEAPRGLYMQYEKYFIDKLGMDVAGSMHIGRSRNDLNATQAKIESREYTAEILKELIDFGIELRAVSKKHITTVMPAYTHYQPAVPITYGFYLQGVLFSLVDKIDSFFNILKSLEECPLGSCSVGGTSIPINMNTTAKCLGFQKSVSNAIYAVATRDFWLELLSAISSTSVLISRISADYLLWNTQEFNFFNLTDNITGSSSIMPNKRNPFILENIQGKMGVISASFLGAITAMQKTPFTNSIAVGTESKMFLTKTIEEFINSIKLLKIFILNSSPNDQIMKDKASSSYTMATEYANKLYTEYNIPFRDAHYTIGKAIRESVQKNTFLEHSDLLKAFQLESDLDQIVKDSKYGGGPAEENLIKENKNLKKKFDKRLKRLSKYRMTWNNADELLNEKTQELLDLSGKVS